MTTEYVIPKELLSAIRSAKRVLIAAHARPDPDAMGSSLALAWALSFIGIDALIFNESGMNERLRFLTLPCPVISRIEDLPSPPGLICCLDCGDKARLGSAIQPLLESVPSVNIDHHLGNTLFGTQANWVDPAMSSAGEMTALLAKALRAPLNGALAEALYVAMCADTGNFSYGNTTSNALRLVADMASEGLNIARIRDAMENNWSKERFLLWGQLMQNALILEEGKLAASLITLETLQKCHAGREDADGFAEHLRRIKGVRVALTLREEEQAGKVQTKASLRSFGADNVRNVAVQFGGGGHRNAAGATLPMNAQKALTVMQPYIRFVWNSL